MRKLSFHIASQSRIKNLRFGIYDKQGNIIESKPLKFRTAGRSDEYEYEGPLRTVFFEEESAPTAENPQAVKRNIMAAVIPAPNIQKAIMLFIPNPDYPKSGFKYNVIAVSLDEEFISRGELAIYNTTLASFRCVVSSTKKNSKPELKNVVPGLNKPLEIYPSRNITFALETEKDGWISIYKDTFVCQKDEKYLMVIYPPRFPGSINVGCMVIPFHDPVPVEEASEIEGGNGADPEL